MIVINSIQYDSYIALCKAYHIDYYDFFEYKAKHIDDSELDVLSHFVDNLSYGMNTDEYIIKR